MSGSRLQSKALKITLALMLIILTLGAAFFWFWVYRPTVSRTLEKFQSQCDYLRDECDSVFQSMKDYVHYVAYAQGMKEAVAAYSADHSPVSSFAVSSLLNHMKNMRTGIVNLVAEIDGTQIPTPFGIRETEQQILDSQWYQDILASQYGSGFVSGVHLTQEDGTVILAYAKTYYLGVNRVVFTAFFNYSDWFGNLERYMDREFDASLLLSADGKNLFTGESDSELVGPFSDITRGSVTQASGGYYYAIEQTQSSYTRVFFIDSAGLQSQYLGYLLLILLGILALMLAMLAVLLYVIHRLTKPVTELSKAMSSVIENDFQLQLEVQSDDEIGSMQTAFNVMSRQLSAYIDQVIRNTEQEQRMRFGLLISQIDQHFVCNALNTVKFLAWQGRNQEVVEVSTALAKILRDRLRLKDFQVFDTVEQELDTVEQYLSIEKYRYQDNVFFQVDCAPELMKQQIPKNILQPLVENAIFHGLADEDTGRIAGSICIRIRSESPYLCIQVEDDGIGISEDILQKLHASDHFHTDVEKGHGIGLLGILNRLQILFQTDFRFEASRLEPHGTRISMRFPMDSRQAAEFKPLL